MVREAKPRKDYINHFRESKPLEGIYLSDFIRETVEKELPPYYGALNAQLGMVRERVQRRFETEAERKSCFTEIYEAGCKKERPLTAEELDTIINRHSGREHD